VRIKSERRWMGVVFVISAVLIVVGMVFLGLRQNATETLAVDEEMEARIMAEIAAAQAVEMEETELVVEVEADLAEEALTEGMRTVVEVEEIGFEVRTIEDYNREIGYRVIRLEGRKGSKNVTYEVEVRDGVEISRKKVLEETTRSPRVEIVVIGMKVPEVAPVFSGGRDKEELMRLAGIAETDFFYADYIISRESGWNERSWNAEGSGAYGLCQALPAGKMASAGSDFMTNAVTQLRWCDKYAAERYGGWGAAYGFWVGNQWW
jgi:hypothetical protein